VPLDNLEEIAFPGKLLAEIGVPFKYKNV